MFLNRARLFSLALVPACGFLFGPARAQTAGRGSVAGVVLNQDGAPEPNAVVMLTTGETKPKEAVAITNERGAFGFSAVPPGRYYLRAEIEGCGEAWFGARSPDQPPAVLTLKAGEARQNLQLRCTALSTISGTVLDSDGDPIATAFVQLLLARFERWKPKYTAVRGAMTNSRGEYRIYGVSPGKYVAVARGLGGPAMTVQPEGIDAQTPATDASFGFQLFRNADRLSSATVLTVAGRKEIAGIDFRLQIERAPRLEGKVVVPPEFDARTPVQVTAYSVDLPDSLAHSMVSGASPPEYQFSMLNLMPGNYVVVAEASAGERRYRATTKVELGDDTTGVSLVLEPGVEITGKVLLEGAADASSRPAKVVLSPGDALGALTAAPEAEIKPDGSFRLTNVLPGIWDIGVVPVPPGGFYKSMRFGDQDVLLEDMVITSASKGPLNIVISSRGGVVKGAAFNEQDAKPSQAVVLLAPEGKLRPVWTFYLAMSTDEEGQFEFRGVTPGSYRLFAFDKMAAEAYQDPGFLAPIRDTGEVFEVPEDGEVTRRVSLRTLPQAGGGR